MRRITVEPEQLELIAGRMEEENDIYVRVTEIILRMIRDIEGKLQTLQECIEQ